MGQHWGRRDWLRGLGMAWVGVWAGSRRVEAEAAGPGRVYFSAQVEGGPKLVAYFAEDGAWTPLLADPGTRPRVAPDGKRIALVRDADVWLADLDGGKEPRKVVGLDASPSGSPPVWSGDGTRLIISQGTRVEGADGGHWRYRTFRVDADGSNRTELPIPETDGVHDWSADGDWLVTTSSRNATIGWTLYRMRPDGTGDRRLTEGGNPFYARFSPDGDRIVYTDGGSDEKRGIWIMRSDGREPRRVFAFERSVLASACWSPDGKGLAVVTCPFERRAGEDAAARLRFLDADGRPRSEHPLPDADRAMTDMPDWR